MINLIPCGFIPRGSPRFNTRNNLIPRPLAAGKFIKIVKLADKDIQLLLSIIFLKRSGVTPALINAELV